MGTLVLNGNLQLSLDGMSFTDYSATGEITKLKIGATVTAITVPATMGGIEHARGGARDYNIEIGFLSNDIPSSVYDLFWSAITDGTASGGVIYFLGTMRNAAESETNPSYAGSFVVTEADIGGKAEELSQSSVVYPMTGPPTVVEGAFASLTGTDISGNIPQTITAGSNDQFEFNEVEYIIPAGVYASIAAFATAVQNASLDEDFFGSPSFASLITVSVVGNTLKFTSTVGGVITYAFGTGAEHNGLTTLGLSDGNALSGGA